LPGEQKLRIPATIMRGPETRRTPPREVMARLMRRGLIAIRRKGRQSAPTRKGCLAVQLKRRYTTFHIGNDLLTFTS
jgi:hypothetical protein